MYRNALQAVQQRAEAMACQSINKIAQLKMVSKCFYFHRSMFAMILRFISFIWCCPSSSSRILITLEQWQIVQSGNITEWYVSKILSQHPFSPQTNLFILVRFKSGSETLLVLSSSLLYWLNALFLCLFFFIGWWWILYMRHFRIIIS